MILVAGGTGLLGTRVVQRMAASGEPVRVLTRDRARAAHLPAGVEVVVGDVRRAVPDVVVAGCRQIVSAVHGFAGPTRTSPAAVDRTGNHHLIAAAHHNGVERFVLVSVVDAAPEHPMSLHRMKYAAEQELRSSGLNGLVVRASSLMQTWLTLIGAKVDVGGPALVFGPGVNPINFVSADDVADVIALGVAGDPRLGDEVSVGGPEDLGFTQIAAQLIARSRRDARTKHIPLAALRAMSVLARPVNPALARQARAAVVMNTTDLTFDARPLRERLPEIHTSTVAEVLEAVAR